MQILKLIILKIQISFITNTGNNIATLVTNHNHSNVKPLKQLNSNEKRRTERLERRNGPLTRANGKVAREIAREGGETRRAYGADYVV